MIWLGRPPHAGCWSPCQVDQIIANSRRAGAIDAASEGRVVKRRLPLAAVITGGPGGPVGAETPRVSGFTATAIFCVDQGCDTAVPYLVERFATEGACRAWRGGIIAAWRKEVGYCLSPAITLSHA